MDLPKEVQDSLKRSDAIWIEAGQRVVPSWFAFKDGLVYVLSQKEPGPEEQTVPGLGPNTREVTLVTRRKGRETAGPRLRATVRLLESGPEWDQAAAYLVDRRRSRNGPPADSVERWRTTCLIAELTPVG
jgi:hypothetical protein